MAPLKEPTFKLESFDDLLAVKPDSAVTQIVDVDVDLIDPLTSFLHPFQFSVLVGIDDLAESIKNHGVMNPVILRPKLGRKRYETLAGHRRVEGSRKAGMKSVPAIIKECDDDTAKIIVTVTNLQQREEILPSEKAAAYQMMLSAVKRKAGRPNSSGMADIPNPESVANTENTNFLPVEENFNSHEYISEQTGESKGQIWRYLRLNELIHELLMMVDAKSISLRTGVELSYLNRDFQYIIYELLKEFPNINIQFEQAAEIKKLVLGGDSINKELLLSILGCKNSKGAAAIPIKPVYKFAFRNIEKAMKKEPFIAERLDKADQNDLERVIMQAVEKYFKEL